MHFGIRVMRVLLRYSGIFLEVKIDFTSSLTEPPTSNQKRWKNLAWRPSGLGALKALSNQRPPTIFELVMGAIKFSTSLSLIHECQKGGSQAARIALVRLVEKRSLKPIPTKFAISLSPYDLSSKIYDFSFSAQ